MSSNRERRERFFATATRAGFDYQTIAGLLRKAATLQRLAEAQCNGDWPYDNGERNVTPCPLCEAGTVPGALKRGWTVGADGVPTRGGDRVCPDCRAAGAVSKILHDSGTGFTAIFGGDPRGYVLKIARPVRVWEYPAGTWRAEITRYKGVMASESEVKTFATEAEARAWYQNDINNGRAESRGDVIGVPA